MINSKFRTLWIFLFMYIFLISGSIALTIEQKKEANKIINDIHNTDDKNELYKLFDKLGTYYEKIQEYELGIEVYKKAMDILKNKEIQKPKLFKIAIANIIKSVAFNQDEKLSKYNFYHNRKKKKHNNNSTYAETYSGWSDGCPWKVTLDTGQWADYQVEQLIQANVGKRVGVDFQNLRNSLQEIIQLRKAYKKGWSCYSVLKQMACRKFGGVFDFFLNRGVLLVSKKNGKATNAVYAIWNKIEIDVLYPERKKSFETHDKTFDWWNYGVYSHHR